MVVILADYRIDIYIMTADDKIGQTLEGRYRLVKLLGEGGMGVVYLGQHLLVGRPVAIKLLRASLSDNEEAVNRFLREARAAAAIGHRNIIDVLDVGVTGEGEPFLVMEHLEGEGLSSVLERVSRMDLATAAGVMEPTLLALSAAHEKGIVHRDLKPENIFLVQRKNEPPDIKLIDFGISKVTTRGDVTRLTQDGYLLGTPAYMSPEQARGSIDTDHRADIYAAGVILYEMLTACLPFSGENYSALLINVLTSNPTPPREAFEGFPVEAEPLIERALAKDPGDRYQSADEMLSALMDLDGFAGRRDKLSALASGMAKTTFAGGDLGAGATVHESIAAAEIMTKLRDARVRSGSWLDKVLREVRKRRWAIPAMIGIVVAILLGSVGAVLCSGSDEAGPEDGVLITVEGAPKGARIYYDNSLVTVNPFRVERGETIVPLRVESKGKEPFRISVTPLRDQVVNVARKSAVVKTVERDSSEDDGEAENADKKETAAEKKVEKTAEPTVKKAKSSSRRRTKKASDSKKKKGILKDFKWPPWKK